MTFVEVNMFFYMIKRRNHISIEQDQDIACSLPDSHIACLTSPKAFVLLPEIIGINILVFASKLFN